MSYKVATDVSIDAGERAIRDSPCGSREVSYKVATDVSIDAGDRGLSSVIHMK